MWRNVNVSCIFYCSKSTSFSIQYSNLCYIFGMMLFTNNHHTRWKLISRISKKVTHWFISIFCIGLDVKRYWTSLRATDCQGYLVPVFLLYLFCYGIKPMSAQELIGTSQIYSGTIGCLKTNSKVFYTCPTPFWY